MPPDRLQESVALVHTPGTPSCDGRPEANFQRFEAFVAYGPQADKEGGGCSAGPAPEGS